MYLCACVRACACLIAFLVRVIKRTFERDGNFTERERERERARARRKDFFRFFYLFFVLSCLVFVLSLSSKTSLSKKEARRKRRNYPTPKKGRLRGAVPFRKTKEKQSPRRKKRQSVRAEPSQRPRPSGTAATRIELSSQPSSSRFLRSIRVRASASVSLCAVCACENLYQSTPKQIL